MAEVAVQQSQTTNYYYIIYVMKIKDFFKGFQEKFERFVENRSDTSKKNIIVFCVITIVVIAVMNLAGTVSPLSENGADSGQYGDYDVEQMEYFFRSLEEVSDSVFPILDSLFDRMREQVRDFLSH